MIQSNRDVKGRTGLIYRRTALMKLSEGRAKKISGIIAITVVLALIGAAAATVVSDVYRKEKNAEEAERQQLLEYAAMIEELTAEKELLSADIGALNQRYSKHLEDLASIGDEYFYLVKRYKAQDELYQFYSGLTPVSGSGIEISLDDGNPVSGELTSLMVVHDTMLIRIVDGLRAAGAQAISINGERIVTMSAIKCVGPSVIVNGRKQFAPYTIKAIGNPGMLYSAFINSEAYWSLSTSSLKMNIEMSNYITIPKYSGTYTTNTDPFRRTSGGVQ